MNRVERNQSNNFMYHPIKWGCKPGPCSSLKKVTFICTAVFLSLSGVGLFLVILGVKEWKRQVKNLTMPKGQHSVLQTLSRLSNSSIKGKVNGVYITTNEKNLDATSQLLKKHPLVQNAIHIGCATWHNFDIMSARKSQFGLIVDFNPKNASFIKKTIDLIRVSASREDFKNSMIDYLNSLDGKERRIYFHRDQKGLPTDRIERELFREGSWLQTEEKYLFMKDLVCNDRLVAITESFTNPKTFAAIRRELDASNVAIDTVYLSNICNFMRTSKEKKEYERSIKHIVSQDTIFISCPKLNQVNSSKTAKLHQVSFLGKEILQKSFDSKRLFEETQKNLNISKDL